MNEEELANKDRRWNFWFTVAHRQNPKQSALSSKDKVNVVTVSSCLHVYEWSSRQTWLTSEAKSCLANPIAGSASNSFYHLFFSNYFYFVLLIFLKVARSNYFSFFYLEEAFFSQLSLKVLTVSPHQNLLEILNRYFEWYFSGKSCRGVIS